MPKRKTEFSEQLSKRFKSFRSGRFPHEAECKICPAGTYVSVAHKGAGDLEKHIKSQKHQKYVKACNGTQKISEAFGLSTSTKAFFHAISIAEAALVFHNVVHHMSYRSMDCTPKLLSKIFPGCEVAKNIKCARTKSEAIVNKVLGPHSVDAAVKALEEITCFGVSTDGSNHGSTKIFPVVIQFFDYKRGGIQAKLVELVSTPNETSDTISSLITNTLKGLGIAEKCVAFGGDNANTNFGGLRRPEGNNIFTKLRSSVNQNIVGIGCSAHILHNCAQHGGDRMKLQVENVITKIFSYFSGYAVRTEKLNEFCDFVDITPKKLLSTTKTRWLSLFPAIERVLEMYEALQSYFLSVPRPPTILESFFTSKLSKAYLWHMHSLMAVFHENVEKLQKEKNTLADMMGIIRNVCSQLEHRMECSYLSTKTREQVESARAEGFDREADAFMEEAMNMYTECYDYLKKWTAAYEEFDCFQWMDLNEKVLMKDVEKTMAFLGEKDILIDETKCCIQICNLNLFLKKHDSELATCSTNDKWVKYFQSTKHRECHSELLKMAEYFFALPAHNATLERIFSLIGAQWTTERNHLSVDSVKGLLCVKFNFKDLSCLDFTDYLTEKPEVVKLIGSSAKYS